MPAHPFLGKRIVVFTAHPDDEGIAAGTMYANHTAGGETFLICATYGEKGKSHLADPVSDAALKRIRKAELLKAAKVLKIDEVIFFGMPDAGLRGRRRMLFEKALPRIKKIAPDYILSFGPDGMSGHLDHITVGEVARRVAKKLGVPIAAFTRAVPGALDEERKKFFLARRKFGKYAKDMPEYRKGDIVVKVDMAVKRRAMRAHVSQFGKGDFFAKLPPRVARQFMGAEHFVREDL
jgi:LmbE family N-acetylglucosaminyl deacetylase